MEGNNAEAEEMEAGGKGKRKRKEVIYLGETLKGTALLQSVPGNGQVPQSYQ